MSGLVPRQEFPLRRWFYANRLWYYHAPSKEHHLHTDVKFFELVDPALRDLCHYLLDHGLFTTPSCEGHFFPRSHFEMVWKELLQEAVHIRTAGLSVKDSETGQSFWFQDSRYRLAWHGFSAFYEQANRAQTKGFLGIVLPNERIELAERFQEEHFLFENIRFKPDETLSALLHQPVFGIYIEPRSPEERDAQWRAITAAIKLLVRADR